MLACGARRLRSRQPPVLRHAPKRLPDTDFTNGLMCGATSSPQTLLLSSTPRLAVKLNLRLMFKPSTCKRQWFGGQGKNHRPPLTS